MPAPSYSALANWDGRLSQSHTPPSRPPSQPSLMPPPPQLPSNTARAAAASPQPRTAPSAASSPSNATSRPSASTSRAHHTSTDAGGSRTSSQSPAASTSWAWSAQIESPTRQARSDTTRIPWTLGDAGVDATSLSSALGHGILSMHGTPARSPSAPQKIYAPSKTQTSPKTSRGPPPKTIRKPTTPVPSKEVLADEIRRHRQTLNLINRDLATNKRVEDHPGVPGAPTSTNATSPDRGSQRIRAPSQTSLRSHRSSEDDDDTVQRMLLASQPTSPTQSKHIFNASSETLKALTTTPLGSTGGNILKPTASPSAPPPERPFALQPVKSPKAHIPPSSTSNEPVSLSLTDSPTTGERTPSIEPTSELEIFGELLYPSSASEHADVEVQASTTTLSETNEACAGPSTVPASSETVVAPETEKTDESKVTDSFWEELARSVAAANAVHIDADVSMQAEEPQAEPVASSEPEEAAQVPEQQRKKTPLFLPSTSESREASSQPSTPRAPSVAPQDDGSGRRRSTSHERSPSVEVIEPSVRSGSADESTLVGSNAPQSATARQQPAPIAGPSSVVSPRVAVGGDRPRRIQPASPAISIPSSPSPPPAPRRRGRPPNRKAKAHPQLAYSLMPPLPRPQRKHYRPFADTPVATFVEEESDDEPPAGPSRAAPPALSPTVSDFARSPPHAPSTPKHPDDDDVELLSRLPSPRVVPSSVSPPTRPARAGLDAPLSPLSPLPPSPAVPVWTKPRAGVFRRPVSPSPRVFKRPVSPSPRTGPSRRPRARSPAEDGWAASLTAAYNRANALDSAAYDDAQAHNSHNAHNAHNAAAKRDEPAPRRKRAREPSAESEEEVPLRHAPAPDIAPGRGLPGPRKRRRKGEEGGTSTVVWRSQSPLPAAPTPAAAGPSRSHHRAPSPAASAVASSAEEDCLVLEGLGGDAVDPLDEGAQTWPVEIDADFDAYVRGCWPVLVDPKRSGLAGRLRFVFEAVGVGLGGGEGVGKEREERGVAWDRTAGEQRVEGGRVEAERVEAQRVEEEVVERPDDDGPDVDMGRAPATPPRAPAEVTVPSRPSTIVTKEAREKRRKEDVTTPSPPEIMRQPAAQVSTPPQEDHTAPPPQAHPPPSQPQDDLPSAPPADQPASPVQPVLAASLPPQPATPSDPPQSAFPVFGPEPEASASQIFSYEFIQARLQYDNAIRSDALRGQDAFLGGIQSGQDDRMDLGEQSMYPSYPADDNMLASHSQWMDPAQSIPQAFLSMPQDAFAGSNIEVDHHEAAADPSAGVNPQLFAHGGVGTIDPSLLGGPVTPPRAHSPTPTPTPPSGSAKRPRATVDDDEWGPSRKSGLKATARRGVGPTGATGKAKGKGRAADVGYRARLEQDGDRELGSYRAAGEPDAKRKRNPSTRAVEADGKGAESEEEGEVEAPAGTGGDKRHWTRAEIMQQAAHVPYCHQCRCKNGYEKMSCGVVREDQTKCGLKFCEKCIRTRYPDMEFNPYAISFECPRCTNTCNCTACCRKRGEQYVPSEGIRTGIVPSALYMQALRAEAAALKSQQQARTMSTRRPVPNAPPRAPSVVREQRSSSVTRTKPGPKPKQKPPPKPPTQEELELAAKMALPQGAVWGTIYGLNMDRIGIGIVAEGATQKVVVARSPGPGDGMPPPPFPRTYSRTTGDSEDSDVDELLPTTPEDVRTSAAPSAVPSATAKSATSAPGASIRGGSVRSYVTPRRTPGSFIGKLQKGWKPLPLPKDYGRGLIRHRGMPTVRAYVGIKPVDRPFSDVDDALDDASEDEDEDRFGCMSGSLTPQRSDGEGERPASDPAHSPSVHPPPGGQDPTDLGFILARALHVVGGASLDPSGASSAALSLPNAVPPLAGNIFAFDNRPGDAPALGADAALEDDFQPPGLSWYASAGIADTPPVALHLRSPPPPAFPALEASSIAFDISSLLPDSDVVEDTPSLAGLSVVGSGIDHPVAMLDVEAASGVAGPHVTDDQPLKGHPASYTR